MSSFVVFCSVAFEVAAWYRSSLSCGQEIAALFLQRSQDGNLLFVLYHCGAARARAQDKFHHFVIT